MNTSSDAAADIGLRVAEHRPEARVVTLVGDIDTPTALELANTFHKQLTVARVVVVDLDGVSFLGTAALATLFEANELAIRQHRALRLVCNSPIANRALAAAGLREYFIFADTVPSALKYPACRRAGGEVAVGRRRHRTRRSVLRGSRPVAPTV
jgi:anti-sigma B factor antagonist